MIKSGENIFESGLSWKIFNESERELLDFLDYIPLVPKHEKVFSFKLLNLFLSTGSHVDNVFKAMSEYNKFDTNSDVINIRTKKESNIGDYRKAFEPLYNLSSKKVYLKREAIIPLREYYKKMIPFTGFNKNKSPQWWNSYNTVKHHWMDSNNIYEANIINTITALAGLRARARWSHQL